MGGGAVDYKSPRLVKGLERKKKKASLLFNTEEDITLSFKTAHHKPSSEK